MGLSGVTGNTSMDAFTRMEDKVEQLEAAAEVSSEMGNMLPGSTDSSIDKQFQLLEAGSAVDDQLAKMKQNLLTGSSSSSSSSSATKPNKDVEDELDRLKREAG